MKEIILKKNKGLLKSKGGWKWIVYFKEKKQKKYDIRFFKTKTQANNFIKEIERGFKI